MPATVLAGFSADFDLRSETASIRVRFAATGGAGV